MTTTINLSQDIHTHAMATAAARGISLSALIEVALRRELAPTRPRRGVRLPTYRGAGTHPGVDLDNSADLLDRMEEHQP